MKAIPLTPKTAGGVCIDARSLEPADIIVSTTDALVSGVIRAGTGSPVSHAALYIGADEVVEAIGQGVVRRSLGEALADDTLAVAYRVNHVSAGVVHRVVAHARSWVGSPYDALGAAGGGAKANPLVCVRVFGIIPCNAASAGMFKSSDKFYCSQLVLEAFRQAGHPIISASPNTSTPEDIPEAYSHGKLLYVGHLVA